MEIENFKKLFKENEKPYYYNLEKFQGIYVEKKLFKIKERND